jgi:hypothetical protein
VRSINRIRFSPRLAALKPHVLRDGTFERYTDGGYPLVYWGDNGANFYHPGCAQKIWRDGSVTGVQVLWEPGDDWPTCDHCGEGLECAYGLDGGDCARVERPVVATFTRRCATGSGSCEGSHASPGTGQACGGGCEKSTTGRCSEYKGDPR